MSDKLLGQADRGQRAEMVLKEIEEIFSILEKENFEEFKSGEFDDTEQRQNCYFYSMVLKDVKEKFEHYINTGNTARKELSEKSNG